MEQIINIDTQLFYWINSHHCMVSDWALWTLSQGWSWAIVIALLFTLLTLRREPRRWWVVAIGVALCFLLADQVSVHCFKDVVCRLRPCHALEEVRMFRTHCGGQYGFISSHAANVFAVATFFVLRYRQHLSTAWLPWLCYLWAAMVCYSRPYLGKHYPGDVICGAIVGFALGAFVWFVLNKIEKKIQQR